MKVCQDESVSTAAELVNKVVLTRSNEDYRFGDVFYRKGLFWKDSAEKVQNHPRYRGTILQEYLEANSNWDSDLRWTRDAMTWLLKRGAFNFKPGSAFACYELIISLEERLPWTGRRNWEILAKTIDNQIERGAHQIPSDDELVIYMRAGDIISVRDLTSGPTMTELAHRILHQHKSITKISLVTCFQFAGRTTGQWQYREDLHQKNRDQMQDVFVHLLKEFPNYEIGVRSSEDPDADLTYLYKAKYLVPESQCSGFGKLAIGLHSLRSESNGV